MRLRACANRRATFRTWHLSEGLNSLLTTAWHIRYSPIGAASKEVKRELARRSESTDLESDPSVAFYSSEFENVIQDCYGLREA